MAAPSLRTRRFPLSLLIVFALAAIGLVAIYFLQDQDPGAAFLATVSIIGFTVIYTTVWFALCGPATRSVRLSPLISLVLFTAVFFALFRIESVSGTMRPQFALRWLPKADYTLVPLSSSGKTTLGAPDLSATSPTDYPRFLGPSGHPVVDGIGLNSNWSEHPPQLVWKQPIGAGWSAFSIVGDWAVTQEQRGDQELTTCYQVSAPEVAWSHTEDVRFENILGGDGPRATPTIDQGRVYSLGSTGLLNCLDGSTGQPVWPTKNILTEANTENLTWGRSCSPLIVDNLLVISAGGTGGKSLLAYNKVIGEPVWSAGDEQASYASPIVATLGGVRQIVVVNEAHVASHAVEDGAILWQFPWPGRSDANASTSQPVPLDDQRLFISKGYHHGCSVWQIKQDTQGNWSTQELWHNRNLKTKFTNVVVQGAFVYGLDEGILTCVRLEDGKRMWKKGRYRNGQVMMIDGKLLVVSESGEVILLEIDEQGSHELGRFQAVEGKTWANPAFSSPFLLIRNSQQAACYRLPLLPEAESAVVTVP